MSAACPWVTAVKHAEAEEERDALPEVASLIMHSTAFLVEVASRLMAEGHYTRSRTGAKRQESGEDSREGSTTVGVPLSSPWSTGDGHLPDSW